MNILADYFFGKALDTASGVLAEITNGAPNPFQEIRRRMGGEAAFEFTLAFERHVGEQEARNAEFREKLRETVTEREVAAFFPALLRAASESSTRERMRMLCAALAGIWRPDLDAELRSRISRAVLELEASDVLYLRSLAQHELDPGLHPAVHLEPGGEWLIRAGCVIDDLFDKVGGRGVHVTTLGHAVLDAVAMWTPES